MFSPCARHLLVKHVLAERNTHATVEELLDTVCSLQFGIVSYPQHAVKRQEVISSSQNLLFILIVVLHHSYKYAIKGLKLTVVKHTTVQMSKHCLGVDEKMGHNLLRMPANYYGVKLY